MKIAIVGTGAMGSVYAGLFAAAGHEVWAIDTWHEHVEAMRARGLRVEGASGDRTVKINASVNANEVGPCDLVIIATKAMHVAQAAESAKSLLLDLLAKRKSEIGVINGAIPRVGKEFGIAAPVNDTITALVQEKERRLGCC